MSRISLTTHTLPKIEFCQVTTLFVPVDRSLKTVVEKSLKMSHYIKFSNIWIFPSNCSKLHQDNFKAKIFKLSKIKKIWIWIFAPKIIIFTFFKSYWIFCAKISQNCIKIHKSFIFSETMLASLASLQKMRHFCYIFKHSEP